MNTLIKKNLTVLFAEDDKIIREEFSEILERMFKKVFISNNGNDAFEIYKENSNEIDIVISDVNMPVMDGLELLEEVRKKDLNLPFIFTTAQKEENYIKKAISLYISDYLIKPIKISELRDKLDVIFMSYKKDFVN